MARPLLALCLLGALAACNRSPAGQNQSTGESAGTTVDEGDNAGTPTKGADRSHSNKPLPDVSFVGPDGAPTKLADLKGPVLVNLWATWCAPCVKELPTLNALARQRSADGTLKVVAISQDMGPQTSVAAFLTKLKADKLASYHDPKMALSGALGAEVLPTSILIDAHGKEVWRYVGDLDWTGPEAAKLLGEASAG